MSESTDSVEKEKQTALQEAYLALSDRERQALITLAYAMGVTPAQAMEHAIKASLAHLDEVGHVQFPTMVRDF